MGEGVGQSEVAQEEELDAGKLSGALQHEVGKEQERYLHKERQDLLDGRERRVGVAGVEALDVEVALDIGLVELVDFGDLGQYDALVLRLAANNASDGLHERHHGGRCDERQRDNAPAIAHQRGELQEEPPIT